MAVRNEEATIGRRIDDIVRMLNASACHGDAVIVSDGSTDSTCGIIESRGDPRIRLVRLATNVGKAAAISRGCECAHGDVLVFADARQVWAPDALERLVLNFDCPRVGAVGGDLVLSAAGALSGVGLYWRYEKWLRQNESRVHSTVGVSGSICAVRNALFTGIPRGTILDDVYWPLKVVMRGFRVVHDASAVAFDRLPTNAPAEFRRKIRTLTGNFQLISLLPEAFLPWRNPIWLQLISHKVLRLLVPWALLVALICSALSGDRAFHVLFVAQVVAYACGIAGIAAGERWSSRVTSLASSFLILNIAAWLAFWVWIAGRESTTWTKTNY